MNTLQARTNHTCRRAGTAAPRRLVCALALLAGLVAAAPATAVLLDFETRGDGTPILASQAVPGDEWASLGVRFSSSAPPPDIVQVEVGRSFDVATTFASNFLRVVKISGVEPTALAIDFSTPVSSLSLDFLLRLPGDVLRVTAFDDADVVLSSFAVPAPIALPNPRITDEAQGSFTLGGVGATARVLLEADNLVGGVLGIDNLDFTPVAEPATVMLLLAPLLALGRRRSR